MIPRIILTLGEPAGIGPDITIQIAQKSWPAELIVVGDPALLSARAKQLTLPLRLLDVNLKNNSAPHQLSTLKIIPIRMNAPCIPGQLNPKNAAYVLECLTLAATLCLEKKAAGLTTNPIHKSIINEAGFRFTGHTEFLAQHCRVPQALMLFVSPRMKVALLTTHISLAQVPQMITPKKLKETVLLLESELRSRFKIKQPRIAVCGLNPHAGENGHLGREEKEIIEPVLNELCAQKITLVGPLPADTIFTQKYLTTTDVILAMYHDQALPVVKYAGFGQAVNVTLGLPIIRTSVDHGTALDAAGTPNADPSSLTAAIQLAIQLTVSSVPVL